MDVWHSIRVSSPTLQHLIYILILETGGLLRIVSMLLTFATLSELLLPFLRRPSFIFQSSPIQWAIPLFCLPYIAYWTLSSDGIPSPSPDLTSSLLQVVIFIIFLRISTLFFEKRTILFSECLILSLLATTSITVKLSNVMFSGIVLTLTLLGIMITARGSFDRAVRFILPFAMTFTIFCARGIVLSGAPLYPSSIGYIETEWSVPLQKIEEERNWIYSWARQPNVHWKQVLGSWTWLKPWLQRIIVFHSTDVVFPLGIFLICSTFAIILCWQIEKTRVMKCLVDGVVLTPLIISLVFWFFTAPDPRFGNATFALLAVSSIALFFEKIQKNLKSNMVFAGILTLFIFSNLNIARWILSNSWTFYIISRDGWQPVKQVSLETKVTVSGLIVYIPVSGDQCWDAPLPCTPYFNDSLRLIDPTNMASGFTIRPIEINSKNVKTKIMFEKFRAYSNYAIL